MPMSHEEFSQLLDETAQSRIREGSVERSRPGRIKAPLAAGLAVAAVVAGGTFAMDRLQDQSDGSQASSGPTSIAGCSESIDKITESAEFTPYGSRRGGFSTVELGAQLLADVTAIAEGQTSDLAPEAIGKESIVGIVQDASSGMVTALYGRDAWSALVDSKDLGAFYRAGGIMLVTLPAEASDDVGAEAVKADPVRVVAVQVGDATGGLSWADPIDYAGLRPHVLQWTSGSENLRLVAAAAPEDLVLAARGSECR